MDKLVDLAIRLDSRMWDRRRERRTQATWSVPAHPVGEEETDDTAAMLFLRPRGAF